MSSATTPITVEAPAPLEMPVPVAGVPSLDELRRLTEVPDRRVVFRGVDWAFYETLVDSIPEGAPIQVDYDGRDVEIMATGPRHGKLDRRLDLLIGMIADEWDIPYAGMSKTTWKRRGVSRGLESDQAYYFLAEKLAQDAAASERGSDDIADFPDPDLAVEVDISRPQVDRAAIYAALRVAEVWRFDEGRLFIEQLTLEGTYETVDSSRYLRIRAADVERLILGGPAGEPDWRRWAREEVRQIHRQEP